MADTIGRRIGRGAVPLLSSIGSAYSAADEAVEGFEDKYGKYYQPFVDPIGAGLGVAGDIAAGVVGIGAPPATRADLGLPGIIAATPPTAAEAAAQPGAATPIQDTRGDPMMGQGGAAVQPARMMTVGSTTNTSRKRAKVTKGEAAADIAARNAATTRLIDADEKYASQNAEILVGEADRLQGAYREQGEQLSSIGAESKALKQRFARLDDELTQAREDVKGSVPIAGATLPTYTRILTGLAAIMEGFAAGVNRRKSNAGQLVQTALNRDLQAQRAVYMDKLRDMNLTQQQRGEAMRRLDVMWGRQQTVLYRQAQLKAAEIGHRTKSLAVNKQATDTVFALGQAARDANMRTRMASRDDVTSRTTTQKQLVGGGGAALGKGGKTLTPKFVDDMNKRLGMLNEGKTLLAELGQLKSLTPIDKAFGAVASTFGGKDPHGTAQARILQWAKAAAKAAGSETGPITKQEADLLLKAAQGNDWDKLQRSARSVAQKLETGFTGMQNTVKGLARTHDVTPIAHLLNSGGVTQPGTERRFGGVKQ